MGNFKFLIFTLIMASSGKINEKVKGQPTIWVGKPRFPFEGAYEKLKQLGNAGQYGVTYQCKHKESGKLYAVKFLAKNRFYRISKQHRHKYLGAMKDEIEILQTVKHRNIITLHEIWEDKTTLYLVMEECRGGELFNRIVAKGKYSEREAAVVIKQLLSALRYMHDDNKIAHCDLKPENILFIMVFGYPPFSCDPQHFGKNEREEVYRKICKGFQPVVKKTTVHGFGPWFPDHIPVSKEMKDLISSLLTKQVRKRYTAREAYSDPWIVNLNKFSDKQHLEKSMVSRLVHFNNERQFKVVITRIFRNQFYKMRPEHFHQLEQLFVKFDKDGNGVLSFDEFQSAIDSIKDLNLEKKHLLAIYEQLKASQPQPQKDVDDGKEQDSDQGQNQEIGIRFNDLLNALVYDYLVACDERLYDAFRKLDDDNDGKITTEELKGKLKQIDPLGEWDKAIEIIESEGLQKDGVIDYEEFLMNLHPNFEEQAEWIPSLFKQMSSLRIEETESNNKGGKEEVLD